MSQQQLFLHRPLYLQLKDALVEKISKGQWKPGETLPNEVDLAREVGVSPGTMRKALDLMESERIVTRRQGRGTFVNDPSSDALTVRFSNIRDTNGQRISGTARNGDIVQGEATEDEAKRLLINQNDAVYRIKRFRYRGSRLFMVENATLPARLFPGLSESPRHSHRIVVLSQLYGILLRKAQERVTIGSAQDDVADRLGLANGTPVLVLDRVVLALDEQPVEWRVGYCHLVDEHYMADVD